MTEERLTDTRVTRNKNSRTKEKDKHQVSL